MSDSRAVLRGDVIINGVRHDKRLLSCRFNPAALDADADGRVDCIDGLVLVGDATGGLPLRTVIGFTLNNAGTLAGNLGYSVAGIGTPFLLDLNLAQPEPVLVSDLAANDDAWEVHTITDMNQAGKLVGYGYRDCGALPQALFVDPRTTATSSALRFRPGEAELQAVLASGSPLVLMPQLSGGSGAYEYRVHLKTPTDADWTLHSGWSPAITAYDTSGFLGDLCARIEARDAQNPTAVQQRIVRYAVQSTAPVTANSDTLPLESTGLGLLRIAGGDIRVAEALGAAGMLLLVAMGLLGLRRRRR